MASATFLSLMAFITKIKYSKSSLLFCSFISFMPASKLNTPPICLSILSKKSFARFKLCFVSSLTLKNAALHCASLYGKTSAIRTYFISSSSFISADISALSTTKPFFIPEYKIDFLSGKNRISTELASGK